MPQLVRGLVPGGSGLVILAGLPKKKKTFLALDLFARLRDGGDFLGRPVTPAPAAYLFLEGQHKALQDRLRVIVGPEPGANGHFVAIRPVLRLHLPSGRDRLSAMMQDTGAQVAFVDPLVYAHEIDENDNARMGPFLRDLSDLAHTLGMLLILVHHQTKNGRDGDSRSIRGAGALAGATEANLLLSQNSRGHRLVAELRDGEGEELDLEFDSNTLRFRVSSLTPAESAPVGPRDKVEKVFEVAAGALEINEIAERSRLSKTSVQSAVNSLCAEGRVRRLDEKRGKAVQYRLVSAA